MPEIGTSGSMSGDGKRSVAEWPKLPRPSSTLPPEERAAKAAAAAEELTSATVTEISGRTGDNQREAKATKAAPTIVEFVQALRAYVVQEFARGKDVDQIFGDLEDSYRRLEKALEKRKS